MAEEFNLSVENEVYDISFNEETSEIIVDIQDNVTAINVDFHQGYDIDLTGYYTKVESDARYKPISYTPTWSEVSGKPTVFTPSAHTHTISEVINLQSTLDNKQDVLTEDNVGSFMDSELSTKNTPTSGDTVLARDILTNKAVEIPIESLGGGDTSNLVPYTGANKDVNIGAYYFETSQGFKKTGGTANQYLMADGSVSTITNNVTGTGTTNYLSKFTASGTIGNSIIYDDGTSVGIGRTSPLGKLHVVQNDISTVAAIIQGGLFGALIQGGSAISNYALSVTNSSSSSLLYVRGDGNVGIGTGSPSEKLDVNGNVKGTLIKDQYGTLRSQRVITITGNTTLSEIHNGAILHITNTCNITIPTGLGADFACDCYVKGAFIAAFVNGGVTLNSPSGLLLKTDKMATLYSSASNVFNLLGELATS